MVIAQLDLKICAFRILCQFKRLYSHWPVILFQIPEFNIRIHPSWHMICMILKGSRFSLVKGVLYDETITMGFLLLGL